MDTVVLICQIVIAVGIFNVWILRYGKQTEWRGGSAKNMKEEFAVYGLPGWLVGLVGFLKLTFAALLIVGIWIPETAQPSALGMAVLMVGAIFMHIKVNDPLKRSLPALTMLVLSLIVAFYGPSVVF